MELSALHEIIRVYKFQQNDLHIMAMHIIWKVYHRLTTRTFNPTKKPIKFSLKIAEAVALRIVLVDVYDHSNDEYYKNVALRITNTITQSLT